MYWHNNLKLLFMVYVDDFKMFGPIGDMNKGWECIRTSIKTDEPSPPGKCLGRNHVIKEVSINGNKVWQMIYVWHGTIHGTVCRNLFDRCK